ILFYIVRFLIKLLLYEIDSYKKVIHTKQAANIECICCLFTHFYAVSCSFDFLPLNNMYVIALNIITYPIKLNTSGPSPKNVKLKIVVNITVEYVKIEISRAGAYLYASVIPNCPTVANTPANNK